MTMFGVAILFISILSGLAFRANTRFRDQERLPMQWWLTGEVTWSAPRILALGFIPILAICVLAAVALLALYSTPRAGQANEVLPTLVGLGVMCVAIQLLHFWLIAKTLQRNGS